MLVPLLLAACAPHALAPEAAEPEAPAATAAGSAADPAAVVDYVAEHYSVPPWDPALPMDHVEAAPVLAPRERPHRALVLLVDFADRKFDRFAGDPDQDAKLADWYRRLLFDEDYGRENTLSHYFAVESNSRFHITGTVLPPIHVDRPLADFGRPERPKGGDWRNDRDAEGLLRLVLERAAAEHPDLDWSAFDRWDPEDLDGDGERDEPDGYVDHVIVVYAGGGQHACQLLRGLDEALNPNVGEEALEQLDPAALACADRIWPHRGEVLRNEGKGPVVEGHENARGGFPVREDLWVRTYTMQCEYTEASTFIHEMGHDLGLPDIYARTSTNSTGPWALMSGTHDPDPQGMSAWARLQLGWLRPVVLRPPEFGGPREAVVHLAPLDGPAGEADRAALVVLPPKRRSLDLVDFPEASGRLALYSGRGNDLDHAAVLALHVPADAERARVEFDAWWEIEGGWDFAYFELSEDGGRTWRRLRPEDPRLMPAEHGHDGPDSAPGFTGLSGDLDGDGKNESNPGCDPAAEIPHGEERAGHERGPCERGSWVHVAFDLSEWAGRDVRVRWRYFTDGAAVENGFLLDNVAVGGELVEDFEDGTVGPDWTLDGWAPSPGHRELLVAHYYLLEYRDPTAEGTYDGHLAPGYVSVAWDPDAGELRFVRARPRPGVVAWYADGEYAWSENDPALNGPGHGYALVVDANPNEVPLSFAADLLAGDPAAFDTRYEVPADAREQVRDAVLRTLCATRRPDYLPPDLREAVDGYGCSDAPAVESVEVDGRPARFVYDWLDLLPGEAREAWRPVGELWEHRTRRGEDLWRLRARTLRFWQTFDAPFSPEPFDDALVEYRAEDGRLVETARHPAPAVARFDDADPARWLNPNQPFGGVAVPRVGLSWEVRPPADDAPAGAAATVVIRWNDAANDDAAPR